MRKKIVVAKKGRENKGLLAIKNIKKTSIVEVIKVSSAIDLNNKYN